MEIKPLTISSSLTLLPLQCICKSLELGSMIFSSVYQVEHSSHGHLHHQLIYMVSQVGTP